MEEGRRPSARGEFGFVQDNQHCSSAGVGPGRDGSFGAKTAVRSWAVKLSTEPDLLIELAGLAVRI